VYFCLLLDRLLTFKWLSLILSDMVKCNFVGETNASTRSFFTSLKQKVRKNRMNQKKQGANRDQGGGSLPQKHTVPCAKAYCSMRKSILFHAQKHTVPFTNIFLCYCIYLFLLPLKFSRLLILLRLLRRITPRLLKAGGML
jgi:hypothetical protein